MKKALGDYASWTYLSSTVNPAAKSSDAPTTQQIAAYNAWVATEGVSNQTCSVLTMQLALTATQVLGKADGLTRDSFNKALRSLSGPAWLSLGKPTSGSIKAAPSAGTVSARFYTYGGSGSGTWTDAAGGEVVDPVTNG